MTTDNRDLFKCFSLMMNISPFVYREKGRFWEFYTDDINQAKKIAFLSKKYALPFKCLVSENKKYFVRIFAGTEEELQNPKFVASRDSLIYKAALDAFVKRIRG